MLSKNAFRCILNVYIPNLAEALDDQEKDGKTAWSVMTQ